MNKELRDRAMSLPPEQRAELAQELWDSVFGDLSEAQKAELDQRLEEHRRDPASAIPYETVLEELRSRIRCAG